MKIFVQIFISFWSNFFFFFFFFLKSKFVKILFFTMGIEITLFFVYLFWFGQKKELMFILTCLF